MILHFPIDQLVGIETAWVVPQLADGDARFDLYPEASLEEWHRAHGLWTD